MKKFLALVALCLILAPMVQASDKTVLQGKWDGKSSIAYEVVTIKPEMKIRPSINPDTKVEFIIVHSVKLFDGSNGAGKAVIDLEMIDYNGNHTFKQCEKSLKGGHDYFYEVITEEMEAKGEIAK